MVTELNANKLTVNELSANNIYSYNGGSSLQWNEAYTTIQSNSANNWDNGTLLGYVHTNFVPLSGQSIYRFDYVYSTPAISYTGAANVGTTEAQNSWTIIRIAYATTGEVLSTARSVPVPPDTGVTWTNRYTHNYVVI